MPALDLGTLENRKRQACPFTYQRGQEEDQAARDRTRREEVMRDSRGISGGEREGGFNHMELQPANRVVRIACASAVEDFNFLEVISGG